MQVKWLICLTMMHVHLKAETFGFMILICADLLTFYLCFVYVHNMLSGLVCSKKKKKRKLFTHLHRSSCLEYKVEFLEKIWLGCVRIEHYCGSGVTVITHHGKLFLVSA